jgi:hypothetical protein
MATAVEAARRPAPVLQEPLSRRILRVLAKTPVQFALILLSLLWLVPTIGLLLT